LIFFFGFSSSISTTGISFSTTGTAFSTTGGSTSCSITISGGGFYSQLRTTRGGLQVTTWMIGFGFGNGFNNSIMSVLASAILGAIVSNFLSLFYRAPSSGPLETIDFKSSVIKLE